MLPILNRQTLFRSNDLHIIHRGTIEVSFLLQSIHSFSSPSKAEAAGTTSAEKCFPTLGEKKRANNKWCKAAWNRGSRGLLFFLFSLPHIFTACGRSDIAQSGVAENYIVALSLRLFHFLPLMGCAPG